MHFFLSLSLLFRKALWLTCENVVVIPYVFIMILGSVITAVGYDYHWPWEAIVIIGYSFLGCQVAALPSIASTYAIDSYKPVTGSLFVTITM